eukprot:21088-Eustigmatos_ZCMA.PRE.1
MAIEVSRNSSTCGIGVSRPKEKKGKGHATARSSRGSYFCHMSVCGPRIAHVQVNARRNGRP